jgi:general secretion pathway protein H
MTMSRSPDPASVCSRSHISAGFSLLELMVALTILALAMSVVSIAASRRSPSFEVQRLSGELASRLREARLAAQTTGRTVSVNFDPETRELNLAGEKPLAIPDGVEANLVSAASAGPSAIVFFPDGSSSGGVFSLTAGGRTEDIKVDWLTSRIERAEP